MSVNATQDHSSEPIELSHVSNPSAPPLKLGSVLYRIRWGANKGRCKVVTWIKFVIRPQIHCMNSKVALANAHTRISPQVGTVTSCGILTQDNVYYSTTSTWLKWGPFQVIRDTHTGKRQSIVPDHGVSWVMGMHHCAGFKTKHDRAELWRSYDCFCPRRFSNGARISQHSSHVD